MEFVPTIVELGEVVDSACRGGEASLSREGVGKRDIDHNSFGL
ncbi:hypothetical protein CCACVL1_14469 [Corchorus capsularis]|uniref:Uncharacterized protein n=1 Tax=Corchorus capsularis TaxID=210143 RepID=A0A1R3I6Y6_COCAP|nr:hypothetical protein CCACVL1_14469 [Corchorus capsularis]